ncbi:hypothetical protein [Streptomyces sp. NPDC049915]|uniref:hypothetical protein n=1 Tax=Streptomyces sp. NPDC049915 TaxID=3155510 RepID=UPI00341311B1
MHRILVRRGRNRLRDLDPPTGEQLGEVIRYEHDRVGDLVHVDVNSTVQQTHVAQVRGLFAGSTDIDRALSALDSAYQQGTE